MPHLKDMNSEEATAFSKNIGEFYEKNPDGDFIIIKAGWVCIVRENDIVFRCVTIPHDKVNDDDFILAEFAREDPSHIDFNTEQWHKWKSIVRDIITTGEL